jgi:hypothetical protein
MLRRYLSDPAAAFFPMLPATELKGLVEDIRANGLRVPIIRTDVGILDGRSRALACQQAGVPLRFERFTGTRQQAMEFAWSANFVRRHLNASQAAAAFELRCRCDPDFAARVAAIKADAAARQKSGKGEGGSGGRGKRKTYANNLAEVSGHPTLDRLAKTHGTNRAYLEVAAKLPNDQLAALRDGEIKMSDVIREKAIKKHEQDLVHSDLVSDDEFESNDDYVKIATDHVRKEFSPDPLVRALSRQSITYIYRERDGEAGEIVKEVKRKHYTNLKDELNARLGEAFQRKLNARETARGQAARPALERRNLTTGDHSLAQDEVSPDEEVA